jgi:hypothetical protein
MISKSLSGAPSNATATVPVTGAPVCEFTIVPEMDVELLPLVVPLPPPLPDPEPLPPPELELPLEPVLPLLLPPLDPVLGGFAEAVGAEACVLLAGLLAVPPHPTTNAAVASSKEAPNKGHGNLSVFIRV